MKSLIPWLRSPSVVLSRGQASLTFSEMPGAFTREFLANSLRRQCPGPSQSDGFQAPFSMCSVLRWTAAEGAQRAPGLCWARTMVGKPLTLCGDLNWKVNRKPQRKKSDQDQSWRGTAQMVKALLPSWLGCCLGNQLAHVSGFHSRKSAAQISESTRPSNSEKAAASLVLPWPLMTEKDFWWAVSSPCGGMA